MTLLIVVLKIGLVSNDDIFERLERVVGSRPRTKVCLLDKLVKRALLLLAHTSQTEG